MDFPFHFKIVILKGPKVFKILTMGALEFLVHILQENHPESHAG